MLRLDRPVIGGAGRRRRAANGGTLILGGGFGGAHVAAAAPRTHHRQPRELDALHASASRGRCRRPRATARVRAPAGDVPGRRAAPRSGLGSGPAARTVSVETELGDVRGVVPAARDRPRLDRPDAADPGTGGARDDVQGPPRRHPTAQPRRFASSTSREADPGNASRHLTFVFVGAGYAGVEALAEMRQLVEDAVRHYPALRGVPQRWVLVDAGPGILGEVPRQLADHTTAQFRRHGVEILTSTTVASVEARAVTLGDGRRLDTATLVWTAGVVANPLVASVGLPLDQHGPDRRRPDSCESRGHRTSGHSGTAPPCPTRPRPDRLDPPTCQHAVRQAMAVAASLGGASAALLLPQHRRRRHARPRPGSGARLPPARARTAGLADHPRLPLSAVPVRSRRLRMLADGLLSVVLRRDIAELGTLEDRRVPSWPGHLTSAWSSWPRIPTSRSNPPRVASGSSMTTPVSSSGRSDDGRA